MKMPKKTTGLVWHGQVNAKRNVAFASHGAYSHGIQDGKVHYQPLGACSSRWPYGRPGKMKYLGQGQAVAEEHHASKMGAKKSLLYITTNKEPQMSKSETVESFEEIFKSEGEHSCPTCGGEVEVVEKGGKKKMRAKRGVAKMVGNEMDPHKGGKTGTFVSHARPGSLGGPTNRANASKNPAPKSGIVKAMFPVNGHPVLTQFTGTTGDESLAQQIQDSQDPTKPHTLYTPPARNMQVEQTDSAE